MDDPTADSNSSSARSDEQIHVEVNGTEKHQAHADAPHESRALRYLLYTSYALSSSGDRMWTFAYSIAMVCVGGDLRAAAISGLCNGGFSLLLMSSIGTWIDHTRRLFAAQLLLAINNFLIVFSAALLGVCLYYESDIYDRNWLKVLLIVTKDWIVTICAENKDVLSRMNANLLRFDLASMIVSPIIAGQIMTSFSVFYGCVFIVCWNLLSYGIEATFLRLVYVRVPDLALPRNIPSQNTEDEKQRRTFMQFCKDTISGYSMYRHHSVFFAGICLALLYMTVLGLDGITTGYAYAQGLHENVLSVVRAVGAIVGISGSFAFPHLRKNFGLGKTGLIALTLQLSCLSLCVVSIFLPGSPLDLGWFTEEAEATIPDLTGNSNTTTLVSVSTTTETWDQSQCGIWNEQDGDDYAGSKASIWTFLAGVVFARFGLWIIDLTVSQILQERIQADRRGIINGVQRSLEQGSDLLKSALVIAMPAMKTFGLLVIISFIFITAGAISFVVYYFTAYEERNTEKMEKVDGVKLEENIHHITDSVTSV